jgi:transcription initiation factor TFIIIB Brf1 subunit/transcription initiation factor TFIIB
MLSSDELFDFIEADNTKIQKSITGIIDLINKEGVREASSCRQCGLKMIVIDGSYYCESCKLSEIKLEEDYSSFDTDGSCNQPFRRDFVRVDHEKVLLNTFGSLKLDNTLNVDDKIITDCVNSIKAIMACGNYKKPTTTCIYAAMLWLTLLNYGQARPIKLICKVFNINTSMFNDGYRIVNLLVKQKVLTMNYKPEERYILYVRYYLSVLGLPEEYGAFLCDMIAECFKQNIGVSSEVIARACGAIFFLIDNYNIGVTQAQANEVFEVQPQTYKKFSDAIIKNIDRLKPVFELYNAPLPKPRAAKKSQRSKKT